MSNQSKFLFGSKNYLLLFISILVIATGFILMIGGGGTTDTDFNPDIFSTRRIIISPIIIIIGYVLIGVSIFYNDWGA